MGGLDHRLNGDARLELALELAELGAFDLDLVGQKFTFSARAAEIYGFDRYSVDWADWFARVHLEDQSTLATLLADLTSGCAEDTRSVVRFLGPQGEWRWVSKRGRLTRDTHGTPIHVGGVVADVTDQTVAEARQQALLEAAQHRLKNVVSIIRAIALRTVETASDHQAFTSVFQGRLDAFARTHAALARTARQAISLEELLDEEMQALGDRDAIELAGPPVSLDARTAELLGLAVHELATNAVRHGALSNEGGKVRVAWRREGAQADRLLLAWDENWPWASAPVDRFGFGRELIERGLPYQLDARTAFKLSSSGLRCEIELPLPRTVQ